MRTLRSTAPRGVVNPVGDVPGTVTGFAEAAVDGQETVLAAFRPDFPPPGVKLSGRQPSLDAFVAHAQPVYVPAHYLVPFTYEPSITTTHDGGFNSPEESAEAMIEWLQDEVSGNQLDLHVHVASEDGYTYSVHVTKDEDGRFVSEVEGVWKGGIQ